MFATCGPNFGKGFNIQAISCEKCSSVFCVGFSFFYAYYNLSEIEFNKVQSNLLMELFKCFEIPQVFNHLLYSYK